MEVLLEAGANPEAADAGRRTSLHLAARYGQEHAATRLLASGAEVDREDSWGCTPLHYSSEWGHLPLVVLLVGAQACVDAVNCEHRTPLYVACVHEQEQVVRGLLALGADPTAQDTDGDTCLHVASYWNYTGVAELLLRQLPGPDAINYEGHTPLHMATREGHREMVALLLAAGADVTAGRGIALMHTAIRCQHLAVFRLLLQAGIDPCAVAEEGGKGLHLAAKGGDLAIMQELLSALASGRASNSNVDVFARGLTPLHTALEWGNTSCMEALVAAGADVNTRYEAEAVDRFGDGIVAGMCPLHRAVELRNTAAVLLLATPSTLRCEWLGDTPLHLAVKLWDQGIVVALLAAGASARYGGWRGVCAMQLAVSWGHWELLPAMIRSECKLCQRLQERTRQQQQQQQQQQVVPVMQAPEEDNVQDPDAPLAAVASSMMILLDGAVHHPSQWRRQGSACFKAVLEVLGAPAACSVLQQVQAACSVLQQVLRECAKSTESVPDSIQMLEVLRAVHSGWSAALQPLTQQRRRLTNRLHYLVTQPLQQQADGAPGRRLDGTAVQGFGWQQAHSDWGTLWSQAVSAAAAGQWQVVVQRLETLTALQPAPATPLLYTLATGAGADRAHGVGGLCQALLSAWWAAQQQVATKVQQEATGAVLSAVQSWMVWQSG